MVVFIGWRLRFIRLFLLPDAVKFNPVFTQIVVCAMDALSLRDVAVCRADIQMPDAGGDGRQVIAPDVPEVMYVCGPKHVCCDCGLADVRLGSQRLNEIKDHLCCETPTFGMALPIV